MSCELEIRAKQLSLEASFMRASFLDPCEVKILIVEDGFLLKFSETADFSLSLLVEYLQNVENSFVRFTVKTAHRNLNSSPEQQIDFPLYQFNNLMDFDEAWFFGEVVYTNEPDRRMSDEAIHNIVTFMQKQKGFFATGDHQDLGATLNGKIPRVRSMRKWFVAARNPDVRNMIFAASRDETDRRDTLQKGDNNIYESTDQTDDIPQEIEPVFYRTPASPVYGSKKYPHPLLCGPRGYIKVLPDHMHEGECIIPHDLTSPLLETEGDEYPLLKKEYRPAPQIIAWASVEESHPTQAGRDELFKIFPPVQPTKFGAISAYDGHPVKVGRVVVESSFHHFLNLNLRGFESSHTDEGRLAHEDIKTYYQNIGIWLAPPPTQRLMFRRSLWLTLRSARIKAVLKRLNVGSTANDIDKILEVGAVVRCVHTRLTSKCLTLSWVVSLIDELFISKNLSYFLNPWLVFDPLLRPDPPQHQRPLIDTELIVDAVLGGIIIEMSKDFQCEEDATSDNSEEISKIEKKMDDAIQRGFLKGVRGYSASLRQAHEFVEQMTGNS
jgi:hypothetical protein